MPARPVVGILAAAALIISTVPGPAASASTPLWPDEFLGSSDYLAGYNQSTSFKKVSIKRFVVPEVECTAEPAGIELGLGYEPVEGAREYLASVVVACVDSQPSYETSVLVSGVVDGSTEVTAGDVITAKLVLVDDTLTATLTNKTNPAGTVSVSAPVRSADGVTYGAFPRFGGGSRLPVPDFGKVKMTKATVAPGSERLNRLGDPGIRTIKKKAFNEMSGASVMPPDDQSFILKRVVHCCL